MGFKVKTVGCCVCGVLRKSLCILCESAYVYSQGIYLRKGFKGFKRFKRFKRFRARTFPLGKGSNDLSGFGTLTLFANFRWHRLTKPQLKHRTEVNPNRPSFHSGQDSRFPEKA